MVILTKAQPRLESINTSTIVFKASDFEPTLSEFVADGIDLSTSVNTSVAAATNACSKKKVWNCLDDTSCSWQAGKGCVAKDIDEDEESNYVRSKRLYFSLYNGMPKPKIPAADTIVIGTVTGANKKKKHSRKGSSKKKVVLGNVTDLVEVSPQQKNTKSKKKRTASKKVSAKKTASRKKPAKKPAKKRASKGRKK